LGLRKNNRQPPGEQAPVSIRDASREEGGFAGDGIPGLLCLCTLQVWFNFLITPGLAGVAVIIIKLVVELARSLEVDQESSAVNDNIYACLE
jgi:hypothetical protein